MANNASIKQNMVHYCKTAKYSNVALAESTKITPDKPHNAGLGLFISSLVSGLRLTGVYICRVPSGIGARVQNPVLGGVDALMPHFKTAEKLRYLNYYYICLNKQSTPFLLML
jgi:hypothetical protein